MTDDQDRTKQEQHWQELADLLGLPPAPTPEPTAEPAQRAEEASSAEPLRPSPQDAPVAHEQRHELPSLQPEARLEELAPQLESFAETELEPWETSPLSQAEELDEDVDAPPPSSRRRRGRRTGRESRRPGAQDVAETVPNDEETETAQPSEQVEGAGEERSKRGRRDRGRKRHKKTPVLEERAEETRFEEEEELEADARDLEEDLDEPAEPEREDEELEDVDTLSDWNVPSWTELIESLYRPDR
jgi:hypothetical protein